jgi:shikimate 5-dehydrogenase
MNDDDRKLAAWIVLCCFVGAILVLLATALTRTANAAALLTVEGTQMVVMSGPEFVQLLQGKNAEIEALQRELARVKKGCPEV